MGSYMMRGLEKVADDSLLLQFGDENVNYLYQQNRRSKFSVAKYFACVALTTSLFAVTLSTMRTGTDENLMIGAAVIDGLFSILPAWCALLFMVKDSGFQSKVSESSTAIPLDEPGLVKFLITAFGLAQTLSLGLLFIGSGTISSEGPILITVILIENQQILMLEWKYLLISWLFAIPCGTIAAFKCGGWSAAGFTLVAMLGLLLMMYDSERTSINHFLELKQAREETTQAQQALDGKKLLTRYVAHEVRSPLNIVHGGLEMVLAEVFALFSDQNPKPSWISQLMDIMESSGVAINTLSDFLQFENMDEGNFNMERALVSVSSLVSTNLKPYKIMAKKNGLSFSIADEVNVSRQRICINVDIFRIDQVIRNLVSNAMKFTARGGSVTVRLSLVERVERVEGVEGVGFGGGDGIQQAAHRFEIGIERSLNVSTHRSFFTRRSQSSSEVAPAPPLVEPPPPPPPPPVMVPTLRIEVIDTGPGIAPENHGKVFGQFQQFNRNELQGGGGSGLGLWISRQMVEMHGGSMGFSSEGLGKGCTFFFELPLDQSDVLSEGHVNPSSRGDLDVSFQGRESVDADGSLVEDSVVHSVTRRPSLTQRRLGDGGVQQPIHSHTSGVMVTPQPDAEGVAAMDPQPHSQTQRRLRLLVVDDSPMNRKFIYRILTNSQYFRNADTMEAADGTVAVEMVKASLRGDGKEFDIVFMDSEMKEMHGPQAATVMRKELGYKGVIVGVTGYVSSEDVASFKAAGADEVLPKPLTKARIDQLATHLQAMGQSVG